METNYLKKRTSYQLRAAIEAGTPLDIEALDHLTLTEETYLYQA